MKTPSNLHCSMAESLHLCSIHRPHPQPHPLPSVFIVTIHIVDCRSELCHSWRSDQSVLSPVQKLIGQTAQVTKLMICNVNFTHILHPPPYPIYTPTPIYTPYPIYTHAGGGGVRGGSDYVNVVMCSPSLPYSTYIILAPPPLQIAGSAPDTPHPSSVISSKTVLMSYPILVCGW